MEVFFTCVGKYESNIEVILGMQKSFIRGLGCVIK